MDHDLPFRGEYQDWVLLTRQDYSLHACRRKVDSDEDLDWFWCYSTPHTPSTAYCRLLDLLDNRLTALRNHVVMKSDKLGENHRGTQIYWLVGYADTLSRSLAHMAVHGDLYPHERQDLIADMYGLICQFHSYLGMEFDEKAFDTKLRREWIWAMNAEAFDRDHWFDEYCNHFGGEAVGWCTEEGPA